MDAIFTFHSIDDSGSVLSYTPDDFQCFVEALVEEGTRIVPLSDLLRPNASDCHRAALTFDDGFASVHRNALPIQAKLGFPATVFAVTEWVGRYGQWPSLPRHAPRFELMSWDELRELRLAGFEVGCHTANHVPLSGLPDAEWESELRGSRARLEDELGVAVPHFAYPYGVHDETAVRRVRQLFDTAVTTTMGFLGPAADVCRLPRIETYYLRNPRRYRPLFGPRTRRRLQLRSSMRKLKSLFV